MHEFESVEGVLNTIGSDADPENIEPGAQQFKLSG